MCDVSALEKYQHTNTYAPSHSHTYTHTHTMCLSVRLQFEVRGFSLMNLPIYLPDFTALPDCSPDSVTAFLGSMYYLVEMGLEAKATCNYAFVKPDLDGSDPTLEAGPAAPEVLKRRHLLQVRGLVVVVVWRAAALWFQVVVKWTMLRAVCITILALYTIIRWKS